MVEKLTAALPFVLVIGYGVWLWHGLRRHRRSRNSARWWAGWILWPLVAISAAVWMASELALD